MVGLRLPAAVVRKIDEMAAVIGAHRSTVIRLMVEHVLERGSPELQPFRSLLFHGLRGWNGYRGRVSDKIASAEIEKITALTAAYLAARRGTKTKARRADIRDETNTRPRLPRA